MTVTPRRVSVLPAANADIGRLNQDDPRLGRRARALLELLRDGRLSGKPLHDMPSYGDMSDCRKVYFAATPDVKPTHRLVYRVIGSDRSGTQVFEVVDVVAVEARDEGYVYLSAAARLGVLPAETAPKFNRVHQQKIAERAALRKAKTTEL